MDTVIDDCDTVIINRDNDTDMVLISLEEYNFLKETEYTMSSLLKQWKLFMEVTKILKTIEESKLI